MTNEQPAGYVCDGCGRLTRDLEQDMHKLKEGNFLSCCPERKMVPVYTRPVAPVEGLERYGQNWHDEMEPKNEGDYVLFSQAEAIIAAKDAEIARLRDILDITERNELREAENNAALTARVKELEKDFYDADKSDMSARDMLNDQDAQVEALETQLAKMREGLRSIARQWPDTSAAKTARAALGVKP